MLTVGKDLCSGQRAKPASCAAKVSRPVMSVRANRPRAGAGMRSDLGIGPAQNRQQKGPRARAPLRARDRGRAH